MTRLNTNNKTLNSLRSRGSATSILAAVLLLAAGLWTTPVVAQDPEVGNTNGYRADKTVDDYMNGNQNAGQQKVASDFDYAGNSLRVEVWVDKPEGEVYRKGQDLGVAFQANQDVYAVVYRIDTEGLVTVLWPRSRFDDGFIFGGHEYQLPVSGARNLRVSTKEGEGIVEAVISQYPFDLRALELDFHHENTADRYDFRVAGDPFLAMNEVNYAVTGLEDSGEYVVTNYASYYVHQAVDHPRYLCNQCHVEDQVAYDPYRDDCTLTIEYDYSWYNGWYDSYGYYPVYGNPVYVYIDPWNYNPWVNYWYTPSYACAPWYGWGWGWGACYSWGYSPYYYGNSVTAYNGGYTRYRPLDRTRLNGTSGGAITKSREYTRGSEMVRKSSLSGGERGNMVTRSRSDSRGTDRNISVAGTRGTGTSYRGADSKTRSRSNFDQVSTTGRSQGGLRIRESGRTSGSSRTGTATENARRRHTAAGDGQRAGLAPVSRGTSSADDRWRSTTRVGTSAGGSSGTSGSSVRGRSNTSSTIGTTRSSGGASDSRSRTSTSSKSVQPRKRSTRVWNSTGGRTSSSQGTSTRSRSGTVNDRSRSGSSSNRSSGTVSPRKSTGSSKASGRSSSRVKSNSGSRSSSSSKSSGSRSSGGSSSRSSSGGSRSSGSRSGSSRR